jgi:hypothetical protein
MDNEELKYIIGKMLNRIHERTFTKYGLCCILSFTGITIEKEEAFKIIMKKEFLKHNEQPTNNAYWWYVSKDDTMENWYKPRIKFLENWLTYLMLDSDEK